MGFAEDVLAGLSRPQKRISPKYLYDAEGTQLYSEICELEEYYPVRVEKGLMSGAREALRERMGAGCGILELGPGGPEKTIPLLKGLLAPAAYVAVEISVEALDHTLREVRARFPDVRASGVNGDFGAALEVLDSGEALADGGRLVLFLGSTVGNFDRPEAEEMLRRIAVRLREGDLLLVGADLLKQALRIERAYNDSRGVTARFNRNLLKRMNRELGAEFRVEGFEHLAFFNPSMHRLEMHLRSRISQTVPIAALGRSFEFQCGETIHTESSYKHDLEEIHHLFNHAGLRIERSWTDTQWSYAVFGLAARA